MAKKSIDISVYQGNIDWNKVKADGVEFVIIRGGLGDNIVSQDDKNFEKNWAGCQAAGIPCTMYLFSYATTMAHMESEVAHIQRLMAGKTMNCNAPIYIDIENTGGLNWRSITNEAMLNIMKAYKEKLAAIGFKMGIYSSRSAFWNEKMTDPWYQNNVSIWVAEYGARVNNFNRPYDVWQYSSSGTVAGINARVDMDWLYADFSKGSEPTPAQKTEVPIAVEYRVYDKTKKKWLPPVSGFNYNDTNNGYAGNIGNPITGFAVKDDIVGDIEYSVGIQGAGWLGIVDGYNIGDVRNGYAGHGDLANSAPIDRLMIRSKSGRKVEYQVAIVKDGKVRWLPVVSGFDRNDSAHGYAGFVGYPICAVALRVFSIQDAAPAPVSAPTVSISPESETPAPSTPVAEPTPTPAEEPKPIEEPAPTPIEEPVEELTPAPIKEPQPVENPKPVEEPTPAPVEEPTSVPIEEPTETPKESFLTYLLKLILDFFKNLFTPKAR